MSATMAKLCLNLLAIAVLIAATTGKPYDFLSILKEVPEERRLAFVKHHLDVGYQLMRDDNEQNLLENLPGEFSAEFYNFVKKEARVVICFPSGECIDVGDTGVHPKKK